MEWLYFTPIILLLVVGFFKVLLVVIEFYKRKKEEKCTDPDLLHPRKLSHSFTVKNSNISDAASSLKSHEPRITLLTDHSFIAFTGDASKSKYKGILFTHPADMPMRIVGQKTGDSLSIQLDEDYGFQMFVGPAKSAYLDKYNQAFQLVEDEIRTNLGH